MFVTVHLPTLASSCAVSAIDTISTPSALVAAGCPKRQAWQHHSESCFTLQGAVAAAMADRSLTCDSRTVRCCSRGSSMGAPAPGTALLRLATTAPKQRASGTKSEDRSRATTFLHIRSNTTSAATMKSSFQFSVARRTLSLLLVLPSTRSSNDRLH